MSHISWVSACGGFFFFLVRQANGWMFSGAICAGALRSLSRFPYILISVLYNFVVDYFVFNDKI